MLVWIKYNESLHFIYINYNYPYFIRLNINKSNSKKSISNTLILIFMKFISAIVNYKDNSHHTEHMSVSITIWTTSQSVYFTYFFTIVLHKVIYISLKIHENNYASWYIINVIFLGRKPNSKENYFIFLVDCY